MNALLRTASRVLPASPARRHLSAAYGRWKIRRARKALDASPPTPPAFLLPHMLPRLMAEGFRPPDAVRYDPDGLMLRAKEKVQLLQRLAGLDGIRSALELGCWDGMVADALAANGIEVCGLDLVASGFDRRARQRVRFVQSDAEQIALADGSVDFAYSFASFEHFARPDRVMSELLRVVRPGGRVFLNFGPLYFSPYGRHAYRQIPVPFCHLLFEEGALRRYAARNQLRSDWPFVNGWSLAQYRQLWASLRGTFQIRHYEEHSTGGVGMELVSRFPACFRHLPQLDELLVSHVDITLEKR